MTPVDFLTCNPCIEEIEGFISGLEVQDKLTPQASSLLNTRLAELRSGRVIPCNTSLPRTWHYDLGSPAKRMTRVEIAVLEERLKQANAARLSTKMDERRAKKRQETRRNSVLE